MPVFRLFVASGYLCKREAFLYIVAVVSKNLHKVVVASESTPMCHLIMHVEYEILKEVEFFS